METQRAKQCKIVICMCLILLLFGTAFTNAQTIDGPLPSVAGNLRMLRNEINTQFAMSKLERYEQALAREIAQMLGNPIFLALIKSHLTEESPSAPLVSLVQQFTSENASLTDQQLHSFVTSLDRKIRRAKQIDSRLDELLELRLAAPSMAAALQQDVNPLVISIPRENENVLTTIKAFDSSGQAIHLDALQAPDRPVLVVGINTKADLRAFISLFNEELRKVGLQNSPPISEQAETPFSLEAFGESVTRLTKYYMRDDHEPWFKGASEIYTVISGVNADMTGAYIYNVDLPSLNYGGSTYYPNTTLIYWGGFAHSLANIEFMEADSGWDYGYILGVVGAIVGVLTGDISFQSAAAGWRVGEAVHQAINTMGWDTTDNDDYVDRIMEIQQYWWYTYWPGIGNNVRIDLFP